MTSFSREKGTSDRTRFEVGYLAAPEGEEYGKRVRFHAVETYDERAIARTACHFLNGGAGGTQEEET